MADNKSKGKVELASGVEVSRKDLEDAKQEGALDAVREGGKSAVLADTGTTGDPDDAAEQQRLRVAPDLQSTVIAPLLDLPLDTLVKRLSNDKVIDPIDFETAKGLLHLERSGQNRTEYVKALMNRIGVDDPRDVTHAGPSYTNDVTNLSHLGDR
jgi:hypothetical protein